MASKKSNKRKPRKSKYMVFELDQFQVAYIEDDEAGSVLAYHLFDFDVSKGFTDWESKLRALVQLKHVYSLLDNSELRKLREATKGKLILLEKEWERTRDVYKSMRLTAGMKFPTKAQVRAYVMSHKSVRVQGKNGKRRNSNKALFLNILRSIDGKAPIKINEAEAEQIFALHRRAQIATGDSHIYVYAGMSYIRHQKVYVEGELEESDVNEEQTFGSIHMEIKELYGVNRNRWYDNLDEFIERLNEFLAHESIEIISGTFDLVVRTFKDEPYWASKAKEARLRRLRQKGKKSK